MGACIKLNDEFAKYFHENEGFALRSERFYNDMINADPAVLVKWIKAAYMAGARRAAQDAVDTLYDYGAALAGIDTVKYTPSDAYDTAADDLMVYFTKALDDAND